MFFLPVLVHSYRQDTAKIAVVTLARRLAVMHLGMSEPLTRGSEIFVIFSEDHKNTENACHRSSTGRASRPYGYDNVP